MERSPLRFALVFALALSSAAAAWFLSPSSRASAPLEQSAYVFQRDWSPAVRAAVSDHAHSFSSFSVLAAEISFHDNAFQVIHVDYDAATLAHCGIPIGFVLRIGIIPRNPPDAERLVTQTASQVIDRARRAGIEPAELQIDYDCPDSRLAELTHWISNIRQSVSVPITLLALPSWMNTAQFVPLVRSADSFVMQVHALHKPNSPDDAVVLCDPEEARADIERACRAGVPFRVALPTYTYLAAWDTNAKLLGLSAEGPMPAWPDAARFTSLSAEPRQMAQLVAELTADHPANLRGIFWYRLPTSEDQFNWRWSCLQSVMSGIAPAANCRIGLHPVESGLTEILLPNNGNADAPLPPTVFIAWPDGANLIAADSLAGFDHVEIPLTRHVVFHPLESEFHSLAPGDRRVIGWIRLSQDCTLQTSLQ